MLFVFSVMAVWSLGALGRPGEPRGSESRRALPHSKSLQDLPPLALYLCPLVIYYYLLLYLCRLVI